MIRAIVLILNKPSWHNHKQTVIEIDTYRVSSSVSSTANSFISSYIRLSLRLMFISSRRVFAAIKAPVVLVPKDLILKIMRASFITSSFDRMYVEQPSS